MGQTIASDCGKDPLAARVGWINACLASRMVRVLLVGMLALFGSAGVLVAAPAGTTGTGAMEKSFAAAERKDAPAYRADVLLREKGQPPKVCGSVQVADGQARLDVDLGKPGIFRALLQPEKKRMLVLSEALKGYVEIPVRGDESDMRARASRVAEAVMPFGVPVLIIREENRKDLGGSTWQGFPVSRSRSHFVAEFMGNPAKMDLEIWESDDFAPFPLRIVNQGGKTGEPGDVVELTNFVRGKAFKPEKGTFVLPDGYSRYSSVMDLLLYALAGQ